MSTTAAAPRPAPSSQSPVVTRLVVPVPEAPETESGAALADRYAGVRRFTETLCEPLTTEDYVVQTMTDVSPTKWHLAHTTWFWETFVLGQYADGYQPHHPDYAYLFNSYYVQAGERHCRDRRGWLTRPTVAEVYTYRHAVDQAMDDLLREADDRLLERVREVVEIGLHHEQQHQELMLTDIKHVLSVNPLRPAYRDDAAPVLGGDTTDLDWVAFDGGVQWIGFRSESGATGRRAFCFDNETPRHRVYLEPFAVADRLVTCGEYLAFMDDGGYAKPELWLSAGWAAREAADWTEPFYWERRDGDWWLFTLGGLRRVDPAEPVCHLSYFEADAYARWAGARLPTEFEWEFAAEASGTPPAGNFVDTGRLHPALVQLDAPGPLRQLHGDVWEWTRSQYEPYPGYAPAPGALGEYNGKFMCNQFVLRGSSCATSASHARNTYRNFFAPDSTWQFTGLRLAREAN